MWIYINIVMCSLLLRFSRALFCVLSVFFSSYSTRCLWYLQKKKRPRLNYSNSSSFFSLSHSASLWFCFREICMKFSVVHLWTCIRHRQEKYWILSRSWYRVSFLVSAARMKNSRSSEWKFLSIFIQKYIAHKSVHYSNIFPHNRMKIFFAQKATVCVTRVRDTEAYVVWKCREKHSWISMIE